MPASNRSLAATAAANRRWSQTSRPDRVAATRSAQNAIDERLLDEIDPKHEMPDYERARRLTNARSGYFAGLAKRRRSKPVVGAELAEEILLAAAAILEEDAKPGAP